MLPRSGPKIAEALKNAYHKILFPLEQQFRIARLRHQQQHPAVGSSGSGVPNMTLETSQHYQLAQMQRMAQLQQQNTQYQQQRGLTQPTPGPQPQTSPQVPPSMAPTMEQRHYAAQQQAQRQPQQQQQPQQAGQPQVHTAPAQPTQPSSQRFPHVVFPSMDHMLTAVALNKQQLMVQMNFTEERADYFLQFERPLIFERIRALQPQGRRQPQNQPPQNQPPQNQPPQNGAAPSLTNGTGETGAEAVPGTTQYLAQLQQQQQQPQSQGPAFRTPQPSPAQPGQQAPAASQTLAQFAAPPSQPQHQQQAQQPSTQPQNPYIGMGRSLPTSIPPSQGATPRLQNISLQNLTLADPKFNEFKRRWANVAPQIRQLREHLQLNNSSSTYLAHPRC